MTAEPAGRWLRVSTGEQDEANQIPDVDRWCDDHEYDVKRTYTLHGKSASKGKQDKALDEVIADMRDGIIKVLVVWTSSRIERRGAWNALDLAKRAREAGGRIEYVKETHLNETNDMSDTMLALAASGNKKYSQDLSKSVRIAFDRIDANGGIRSLGGYGHRIAEGCEKYNKRFEIDEAEAEVIRLAVSRYLKGQSLAHVCRWFTANGIYGRSGAKWTPKTLGHTLRNETLIGRYRQGSVTARVPAIITVRDFKAVQEKLDAKAYRKGVRSRADMALLTSILYCGKCGGPMYRLAAGRKMPIYYCYPKNGQPSCKMTVPLEDADQEVIETVGLAVYLNHRTEEIVIPGHDYQDDIDQIVLDIKALDPTDPNWLDSVTAMHTEIARLKTLPPEPDIIETRDVDTVAEANVWQQLPLAGKRQRLLDTGVKLYAVKDAGGNVTITRDSPLAA